MATGTEQTSVGTWADEFRRVSDEDPELHGHGKHYSCSYMMDMEEHQIQVVMYEGKVEDILVDPDPLDKRYQFELDTTRFCG